jgi:hypothetical protein
MLPEHERYLLQIWSSRALAGRQWAARLDRLSDGDRRRFTDPEALLQHVRALVQGEPSEPQPEEKGKR